MFKCQPGYTLRKIKGISYLLPYGQQIADLKKQLDEKDDQYLRAQAEIQNMNNHFKKERAQLIKYDGQGLAKDILPVLDNLKRALATQLDDKQAQEFKKGIQMVHDHL